MIRRRSRNGNTGALTVPLAMVDTWLLLVGITVIKAEFDIAKIPLPELMVIQDRKATGEASPALTITILSSGELQFGDVPISIADVAAAIKAEPDNSRPVKLNLETNDDGQGNTTAFLQLVRELSQVGLGHRINIPVKKRQISE